MGWWWPWWCLGCWENQGAQEAKREDNLTAIFKPGQAPSERQVDDGSGTLTVWYMTGMDLVSDHARVPAC